MKKFLKIIATLLILIIIVAGIFIATFKPPRFTDYGYYGELAAWATEQFKQQGMQPRPISEYFKNFSMPLGFPFSKLFGLKDRAFSCSLLKMLRCLLRPSACSNCRPDQVITVFSP